MKLGEIQMGVADITVTQIRDRAVESGITPGEAWEMFIYPALSASSSTDPGEIPNSAHSWWR